jgi:signal transduction histidine kinase
VRDRLAFKVFLGIFLITAATLGSTGLVVLSRMSARSEREYLARYSDRARQLGDTLNELDKTTDLIAINALNALWEKERRGGLLSNGELARLRDELRMENLYILDRDGVFQRSDWYLTVAADPKLRAYYGGGPPLTTPLFSYCEGYRALTYGASKLERTPIIPNPPGLPYERINKYLMVPNHDRTRILEASVSMDFIAEVLNKAMKPDRNVVSIGLYTPSGDALGFVHDAGKTPLSKLRLESPPTGSLEPRAEGGNLVFSARVEPTVEDCCECKLKQLSLPDGRYFYLLRLVVSQGALREQLAEIRRVFLLFGVGALLLSVLAAVYASRRLVGRLERMGAKVRRIAESDDLSLRVEASGGDEVGSLGRAFNEMLGRLEANRATLAAAERDRAYADLARQVAHDIRSPLAALGSLAGDLAPLPERTRGLVASAVARIRGIAEDLHRRARGPKAPGVGPVPLAPSVSSVLGEKAAKHRAADGIAFLFEPAPEAAGVAARVDRVEFERVLSNLVENAVEALSGRGTVTVSLGRGGGRARLAVQDDGQGIPPELLAELGNKGATFGKPGGSGLGLHHARACAEAWGGTLTLRSRPGEGTTVVLELPEAVPDDAPCVLIDDDPLVRKTWEVAAKAAARAFTAFPSVDAFLAASDRFPPSTRVYLDSDLGGGLRGEVLAAELHARGYRDVTLATGHAPEEFAGNPYLKAVIGKDPPWP